MLNSSSKHHTANMKLFLLTVLCIAAALAGPITKQKRDILPGDPRYGTDAHHHHAHHHSTHENEVQVSRAIGGYVGSYVVPNTDAQKNLFQVQQNTYGPPNYEPNTPLNNKYLTPVVDAKQSVPVPNYGVPDSTVQVPSKVSTVSKNYLEPAILDTKQSHTHVLPTTSYGIPLQNVKTTVHSKVIESEYKVPAVDASITSYGTPLEHKTSFDSVQDNSNVQPTHVTTVVEKTVEPKVQVHEHKHLEETKTISTPTQKISEYTPAIKDAVQHTLTEVKSGPTATGVDLTQKTFDTSVNTGGSFGSLSSTSGFSDFSGFDTGFSKLGSLPDFTSGISSLSSIYNSQPSFDTGFHTYGSLYPFGTYHAGLPLTSFDQHVHLPPVSLHLAKHTVPVAHTFEGPRPFGVGVQQEFHVKQPVSIDVQHTLPYQVHQFQKTSPDSTFFHSTLSEVQTPHIDTSSVHIPSGSFVKPTTETPILDVPASIDNVNVGGTVENESITVENPLFKSGTQFGSTKIVETSPVKVTNEYVQPTDENGGYIY